MGAMSTLAPGNAPKHAKISQPRLEQQQCGSVLGKPANDRVLVDWGEGRLSHRGGEGR